MLTGLVVSLFFVNYGFEDNYLDVDIQQNNNVNNPINYKEKIDKLRKKYKNDDVVGILLS